MAENLSAYERSLSAPQLYAYMVTESQQQWRLTKSAHEPYDPVSGLDALVRRRPALYTRYQQVVLRHEDDPAPLVHQAAVGGSRDEARQDLETLAKEYVSLRLVRDEGEGLAMAVQMRPDLYHAFARPPDAAQGPPDPDPLRELHTLAREYVVKRLETCEDAGMRRAIREHPDLYEAHRKQVQAVTVQKVVR